MIKQICNNSTGELDSSGFTKPLPYIGLYIALASSLCLFFLSIDIATSFRLKTRWVRCKLFKLNSITLTLLSVATKIPVDLNTSMPGPIHQLTKLSGTVMLCTTMAFTLPSLGAMEDEEILSNVVALALLVITVAVDICFQIGTGAILSTFWPEHILNTCFMMLSLLILSSSAPCIKFIRQRISKEVSMRREDWAGLPDSTNIKDKFENCEKLLHKAWLVTSTGNPQFSVSVSSQCFSAGWLSILSGILLLEAEVRFYLLPSLTRRKRTDFCRGGSDYGWSIPIILLSQTLFVVLSCAVISIRVYYGISFREPSRTIARLLFCDYETSEYKDTVRRIKSWIYSSWELHVVDFGLPKWLAAIVIHIWNVMVTSFDIIYKAGWWVSGSILSTPFLMFYLLWGLATCFSTGISDRNRDSTEVDEEEISGYAVPISPFIMYKFNDFKLEFYANEMSARAPKVINSWISSGTEYAKDKYNVDFINFITTKTDRAHVIMVGEEGRDPLFVFFKACINTFGMDFFLGILANINKWVFMDMPSQDAKEFMKLVRHARGLALFVDKHAFAKEKDGAQDGEIVARNTWFMLERKPSDPEFREAIRLWDKLVGIMKDKWPRHKKELVQVDDDGRIAEYDYDCPLFNQLPSNSELVHLETEMQLLNWFWQCAAHAIIYGLSTVVDKMHTLGQAKFDLTEEDVREAASMLGMLQGFMQQLFPSNSVAP